MKKLIKKYWWVLIVISILFSIGWIIILSRKGYFWMDCTGFNGKNLWDILELALIPLTIAIIAYFIDKGEKKADREIALDNQREMILQNYIDVLTGLILKEDLKGSNSSDEVREIARVKTLTTLERLDSDRKSTIIKFLSETELIQKINKSFPIISLEKTELCGAPLYGAILRGADLRGADLQGAILDFVNLQGANLEYADLRSAILLCANLESAILRVAHLYGAFLRGANLRGADLQGADLEDANLATSHLEGAYLRSAKLEGANLRYAHLEGADLTKAIMPDGKEYDPKIHTIEYLTGKKPKDK